MFFEIIGDMITICIGGGEWIGEIYENLVGIRDAVTVAVAGHWIGVVGEKLGKVAEAVVVAIA
jgi:hypothetical protein